jgi:hypothetical protein
MKKVLLIVLLLGVIGAGVGYYMYNKPVASLEHKKADLEITAAGLIEAYEANEKAADSIYLGKIVAVSGKISEITNEEGKLKINLETSSPIALIICEMEAGVNADLKKPGDEIKIKGLCSGYLSDVILVQSTIVP